MRIESREARLIGMENHICELQLLWKPLFNLQVHRASFRGLACFKTDS